MISCLSAIRGGAFLLVTVILPVIGAAAPAKPRRFSNYDVRRDESAQAVATRTTLRGRQRTQASEIRIAGVTAGMKEAHGRLAARTENLRVQKNPQMDVPEVLDADGGAAGLNRPSRQRREAVVRSFVTENAALFGLSASQAANLKTVTDTINPGGNLAWVELQQTVRDIPVFQGAIRAAVRKDGAIARTTGTLAAGLDYAVLPMTARISPAKAVQAAARAIGVEIDPRGLPAPRSENDGKTHVFPAGTFDRETKADLTYFPMEPGVATLAYSMVLWEPIQAYWVLVDAENGELLWRKNITNDQTQSVTYSVYGSDSPAPLSPTNATPGSGIQGAGVPRTSFTIVSELPEFDNLGWIPDGANTTTGNNVDAGLDLDLTNGIDSAGRANGTPNRIFNFAYIPGGNPGEQAPVGTNYRMGAVTNLFFWSNRFHDRMYQYGFTEAFRNFQQNNFSRGGSGNDRVLAEAQDGSGTDNANFSTPPDGQSGRMQMYIFTGPLPDRDGDLDQEIVLHELTHGLSNRLHANSSGLVTYQSAGMGEGWSDFYARCLLATADEDVAGVYASGGYSTRNLGGVGTDNYYYGIRRFPYAVKTTVGANGLPHNPLTFGDIDPAQALTKDGAFPQSPEFGNTALEVHNIGEVWCMALLEVRARIIARLGFEAGTDRILQIVTDGMKLDPASPTFVQARDSIIAADLVGFGGADLEDLWAGFAAVGLGFGAAVTDTDLNPATVTESFFTPNLKLGNVTFSDAAGNNNGFADPGETIVLTIPLVNTTSNAALGATAEVGGATSAAYGDIASGSNVTREITFTVPPSTPSGTRLKIPILINSSLGLAGPATPAFSLTVGQPVNGFVQNFDATSALPSGWTTARTGAGSAWTVTSGNPDTPTRAAFTPNSTNVGSAELVTPGISITSPSARLTFRNSYNLETDPTGPFFFDGLVLEISIDGAGFEDIIEAGGTFLSGGYNCSIESGENPLGGRNGWSGLSGGTTAASAYITTAILLPASLNGHNVRLKWRLGTDGSVAAPGVSGVRIDTVTVATGTSSSLPTSSPVITISPGDLIFIENQGATAIDPGLIVTDADSTNLAGATVSISGNLSPGEDALGFTDQNGITGVYDSTTGTLTLSGTATLSAYQLALRSVSYQNSSENPGNPIRTVNYAVSDGQNSASGTRNIAVISVNDAPTLAPVSDPKSIPENSGLQSASLSGISAGGGETQILSVTATSSNPAVIPDPVVTYTSPDTVGSISFVPERGRNGDVTLTITVTDDGGTANGGADSISRTFQVRVGEINDPPVFIRGPDVSTPKGGGPQVIPQWATAISPGPPDEENQHVTFLVLNDNASIFQVPPAIDSSGTLTYTPSAFASGIALVTVSGRDDGGTVEGGRDTSSPQPFQISITSFLEEVGSYSGLIQPPLAGPRENARTGSFQAKLSAKGRFTGRVVLAGKRYSFKGGVGDDGVAHFGRSGSPSFQIKRRRDTPLALTLTVDVATGSGSVQGLLRNEGSDFATILADRIVYSSQRHPGPPLQNSPDGLIGTYTVVFPALPSAEQGLNTSLYPQGDGFGRVVVKRSGVAKLSGRLADGSKVSGAAPIALTGRWAVYDGMRKHGSILGFAHFRDVPGETDIDASNLLWFKSANRRAKQYPSGWPAGILVNLGGSKYNAPSRRHPGLVLTGLSAADSDGNAELTLTDGGLGSSPLIQALIIDPRNRSRPLGNLLKRFKFKLSEKKGLFSGQFVTPTNGRKTKFEGAVLQKQQIGSGYFLGAEGSGAATLTPDSTPGTP
jgi:hypothetical protein